jgi:hypothetical protein
LLSWSCCCSFCSGSVFQSGVASPTPNPPPFSGGLGTVLGGVYSYNLQHLFRVGLGLGVNSLETLFKKNKGPFVHFNHCLSDNMCVCVNVWICRYVQLVTRNVNCNLNMQSVLCGQTGASQWKGRLTVATWRVRLTCASCTTHAQVKTQWVKCKT